MKFNWLTLWGKYAFDEIRGRNTFTHFGTRLRAASRPVANPQERVWFPVTFYLDRGLAWQTTIARALETRGHDVAFSHFDIAFPRRNGLYFDQQDRGYIMPFYKLYTNALLKGFGFQHRPFSEFGSAQKFAEYWSMVESFSLETCRAFQYRGFPLGAYVHNPLIHYFRCSTTTVGPHILDAWRDYLAIGMIMVDTFEKAFDALRPTTVVLLNGSFLDSRIQLEIARRRDIRVITFEAGFMLNSLMLGINESIINFPMAKYLPKEYQSYQLSGAQEEQLDGYLRSRSMGKDNIFDYWRKPIFDAEVIYRELGLTPGSTPDILFTNLLWDSAMLDCDIAFANQLDWMCCTIDWYAAHPDRVLLIRIHPAEVNPPSHASTDRIEDALRTRYAKFPKNVILIPPTSKISSYPLTAMSHLSLVYSSTAGLEAAMMGKPAVVSGKTHYRGQGFTHDVTDQNQYINLLANPVLPADRSSVIAKSRKYSYFFFFRYNISFPLIQERPTNDGGSPVDFRYTDERELLPGKHPELDFVIQVITGQTDYRSRLREAL